MACEYCKFPAECLVESEDTEVWVQRNVLFVHEAKREESSTVHRVRVNYCPMCGEPLGKLYGDAE